MPRITVIGDVHGHLDKMIEGIDITTTDFALQVGDFGVYLKTSNLSSIPEHFRSKLGQFDDYFAVQKPFPIPTYFCKGNHEDFQFLGGYEDGKPILPNLHYVPNGKVMTIHGVRVAFLGGNFSAKNFEQPVPKNYQSQKLLGYLRKREIETLMQYPDKIDILITHEPSFGPNFFNDQYGCQPIQELIEAIQPAYAFSGHIHKYAEGSVGRTKCIALGAVNYNDKSMYQFSL